MSPQHEIQLSPEDQRLLDALVEAGFDRAAIGPLTDEQRKRVDAIACLLGLMNDYPVEDADEALLHATLARIDRYGQELAARMKFDAQQQQAEKARFGWRIRVPDFLTVAAVLLIGVSVLWPMLSNVRQKSIDTACANNMRMLSYAFGQYAGDNNNALPIALAGPMGSWDTVKNVLNLEPLVRGRYCDRECLNCPGHSSHGGGMDTDISYSYRWFLPGTGASPVGWGTGRVTVVIGDLNPIIDAARRGQIIPPLSMSLNHGGRGQNVLSTDGAVLWLGNGPVIAADNIWLPNGAEQLRGGDRPADALDVFLAH